MELLTSRQQSILNRVVDTHIHTAQPVGSRTITEVYRERYRATFSSATVRFEMGILEEKGYLTHPHTSAGRIPTGKGYRYYVNHCVQPEILPRDLFRDLAPAAFKTREKLDSLMEKASKILSEFTEEAGMMMVPEEVTETLEKASGFKFFLQGTTRLLEKPEFRDIEKVRALFKIFEEKKDLLEWLRNQSAQDGVSVVIGEENRPEALQGCSLVITSFFVRGESHGAVAILGPTRMRYARVLPLVEEMAKFLGAILDQTEES